MVKLLRIRGTAIIFSIMLLGTILRLYGLTAKPLWYDEIGFFAHALKGFDFMFQSVANYKIPYIILLKGWIAIFGMGVFATRLLSVILGVASIFLTYQLGKRLFNIGPALIAAFLLSISCFDIYHSQQVKHYGLLTVIVMLSFIFFIDFFEKKNPGLLVVNLLLNILAVCTHPFGISAVLIQVFYVIFMRRSIKTEQLKQWLSFQFPLTLFLGLWSWILFMGRSNFKAILWWSRPPALQGLIDTFSTFIYGGPAYGLSSLENISFSPVIAKALMLIFGFFFVRGLVIIMNQKVNSRQVLVVIWVVLPVALSLVFSYFLFPVYFIKNFLFFLPAFYLIVARGVYYKRQFISGVVLAAILVLNTTPLKTMYNAKINVDWKKAVDFVKAHELKIDDIFITATTKEVVSFMYYLGDADQAALKDILIFGKFEANHWQESFQYRDHLIITLGSERNAGKDEFRDPGPGLNLKYSLDYIVSDFDKKVMQHEDVIRSHRQIWILISQWAGDAYGSRMFIDKLDPHYKLTLATEAGGINIYRLSPRE